MNDNWLDFLRSSTIGNDNENSGNAAADIKQAATGATIIAPLTHLGVIEASGADASNFLHNLLTNDIDTLGEGVRRAGLCTPKGRLLADFLVWRDADNIHLQLSADLLPAILKKLSMYVLRSKVKLSDASSTHVLLGLAGPQAGELLAELNLPVAAPMQSGRFDGGTVIGLTEQRFELVVDAAHAVEWWQRFSVKAHPAGPAAWRWLDIAAGIPLITAATSEQFVPQMVNYELIGGVGFKKGCYPGQEIVARTQYLGKIKRRMYRAHVAADVAAGDPVYAAETGEQACGTVVLTAPSPDGGSALLLVAQKSCADGGALHLGDPSGPVPTLLPLPYAVE